MDVNIVHNLKALVPILVTPVSIVTVVNEKHASNTPSLILAMLLEIVTDVNDVQN